MADIVNRFLTDNNFYLDNKIYTKVISVNYFDYPIKDISNDIIIKTVYKVIDNDVQFDYTIEYLNIIKSYSLIAELDDIIDYPEFLHNMTHPDHNYKFGKYIEFNTIIMLLKNNWVICDCLNRHIHQIDDEYREKYYKCWYIYKNN
jgi:hypothetical protein